MGAWGGTLITRSVEVSPFTFQIPDELLGRLHITRCLHSLPERGPKYTATEGPDVPPAGGHRVAAVVHGAQGGKREARVPTRAQPAAPHGTVAHGGRPGETPAARDKQIDSQ